MTEYRPRIMISGETGGTGASTTAKLVAKHLNLLPTISGGKYFRGIANRYGRHVYDNGHLPDSQNYENFYQDYQKTYESSGLDGVNHLIGEGLSEGANGDLLHKFETAIEYNHSRTKRIDTVWDYIVDQNTIRDALSRPGFVWEGKVATLALELDQMQAVIPQNEFTDVPYLNVLLHVDPRTAAKRVGERENRSVDVKEIETRKKQDYTRYAKVYTINNRPVTHKDLLKYADIRIDTKRNEPSGVVSQSLISYLEKIETIGKEYESLALPMIKSIQTALQSLQK